MGRAAAMLERLPLLYREGELITDVVSVFGLQNEILDEETFEVQRAHWFDTCLNLDEAVGLAAVLDIAPEPWQTSLGEYRPWVHALRDAQLREGSVTLGAVRLFVEHYVDGFEAANRTTIVTSRTPRIIENPTQIVLHREGSTEPLQRFTVTNRGLDPAPLAVVATGLGSTGPEYAPMLANLTTGDVIVYRGAVEPGKRLILRSGGGGPIAELEGVDVSHRLRIEGTDPLQLARGDNDMWFLPLAHYDTPGLDRFLLYLAGDALRQGRWNGTDFDDSLFYQDPALVLNLAWIETIPATFRVELAAAALRTNPGELEEALAARQRLVVAINTALDRLAAAGVRTEATLADHQEHQPTRDRLQTVLPVTHREGGPTGADRRSEHEGLFDVTDFDDSTLR